MVKYRIYKNSSNRDNGWYDMGYYLIDRIEANNPKEALDKFFETKEGKEELQDRYYKDGVHKFEVSEDKYDENGNFSSVYIDKDKDE